MSAGGPLRRARRLLEALRASRRLIRVARRRPGARAESTAGVSAQLRAFVDEFPEERSSVLAFIRATAAGLPPGTRVLDAGAGDAPYRELFAHCEYVTADWENSPHERAAVVDIRGSLEALPVEADSFDAIVSTQVLEHVAEPLLVLRELFRVLRPGGRLYLTAPLAWELHEQPYDYFRYTAHGLRHLLTGAGFTIESITPRNGYFTSLAGLARTGATAIWQTEGGRETERGLAYRLLRLLTSILPAFDELDEGHLLPLGYTCIARRPQP